MQFVSNAKRETRNWLKFTGGSHICAPDIWILWKLRFIKWRWAVAGDWVRANEWTSEKIGAGGCTNCCEVVTSKLLRENSILMRRKRQLCLRKSKKKGTRAEASRWNRRSEHSGRGDKSDRQITLAIYFRRCHNSIINQRAIFFYCFRSLFSWFNLVRIVQFAVGVGWRHSQPSATDKNKGEKEVISQSHEDKREPFNWLKYIIYGAKPKPKWSESNQTNNTTQKHSQTQRNW